MALETPSRPPPLHGKNHLKFPFWLFDTFPYIVTDWQDKTRQWSDTGPTKRCSLALCLLREDARGGVFGHRGGHHQLFPLHRTHLQCWPRSEKNGYWMWSEGWPENKPCWGAQLEGTDFWAAGSFATRSFPQRCLPERNCWAKVSLLFAPTNIAYDGLIWQLMV